MENDHLEALRQALRAATNPQRAANEQRYLKSTDAFLGVTVPAGHALAKAFQRAHADLPLPAVRQLADALWHAGMHEEKRLAVQLLERYAARLTSEEWPLLERWVRVAGSWDLVDGIAAHLLAVLVERFPALEAEFDRWVADENLWVRRAVLVTQVPRIRHAAISPQRIWHWCDYLAADREYFVRKALGWVLRECAMRDPDATIAFLRRRSDALPRCVLREAVRKLDPSRQQAVLSR